MNYLGHLCRELAEDAALTQRALAQRLGISLGKCNALVRQALQEGYICQLAGGEYEVAPRGRAFLRDYRVRNAVILASDIDPRFVSFNQRVPKPMMQAEGERLIERIIRQLQEKGIHDITVVVGYLAEKYEYLADKHGVRLVYNPEYTSRNNLVGVYLVRHLLHNTYLLQADYFFPENIFHEYEPESWMACYRQEGESQRWCLHTDSKRRVREINLGGQDALVQSGPLFLTGALMQIMLPQLEYAYGHPGVVYTPWEAMFSRALDEMEVYANVLPVEAVREFNSFEDLRDFDISYKATTGAQSLQDIGEAMGVRPEEITDMRWIETNAVNYVFLFHLRGHEYVFRAPGDVEGRFNTFKQEASVYRALAGHNMTDVPVYCDVETGVKISRRFQVRPVYPDNSFGDLRRCVQTLRRLHTCGARVRHNFTMADKLRHYDILCRREGCIKFEDYTPTLESVRCALRIIEQSSAPRVLCHLNAVANDLLEAPDGNLCFAHWEFAGMCHAIADIAILALYCDCTPVQAETLLEWYHGRPATGEERQLLYAYMAAGGLLWSIWGEYRNHCGEDFVEFAVRMYRQSKRALKQLEKL